MPSPVALLECDDADDGMPVKGVDGMVGPAIALDCVETDDGMLVKGEDGMDDDKNGAATGNIAVSAFVCDMTGYDVVPVTGALPVQTASGGVGASP